MGKAQYMQAATEHKIPLGLYNVLLIIKKLSILYKHTSSILYMYFSEKSAFEVYFVCTSRKKVMKYIWQMYFIYTSNT